MQIDTDLLRKHRAVPASYDAHPDIETCDGCSWVSSYDEDVTDWEQYIRHLEEVSNGEADPAVSPPAEGGG